MSAAPPVPIHLKDYRPPAHIISHVRLNVSLHPTATRVVSELTVKPQDALPLILDGAGLELVSISINGTALAPEAYTCTDQQLIVADLPHSPFVLRIEQLCNPQENTALSGLYLSNGVYCTQMEAEGFRRFAYMYDRPDVMATYDVRLEAPAALPILLSNGNLGQRGIISESGHHFVEWHDPHPKPTYLFALVAGDLAAVHDTFTTASGKQIALCIYVEKGKDDRCGWAMESLKASMRWDEKVFGREYDLDVFNIVAVSDFNMGAMENKGLNIFNDKYILARPDTATDLDHVRIEAIIAHEYFHNWTGNRITCRDWFQLCLKEGLTVFRDQEFTSDMRSRAVKRIDDVRTLRARQFPEDQGPLAHPARPDSYIEINNFYTPTVYEKGAEICRMMKTLIGGEAFRKAMDLYFLRHDGEAVTVEDFVRCMADSSGRDLTQFFRWYGQAGTPILNVKTRHDAKSEIFELDISQHTPVTPGQLEKAPLHMPLALGLLDESGHDLLLHLEGKGALNTPIIELTKATQTYRFTGIKARPVLSLNRGFTAPVVLKTDAMDSDRLFLLGHDSDPFNRWEAAQSLGRALLISATAAGAPQPGCAAFAEAIRQTLIDPHSDDAFKALMLDLPSEAEVAMEIATDVNAEVVHDARTSVRRTIGRHILPTLQQLYESTRDQRGYVPDTAGVARRSLRYALLGAIASADRVAGLALAVAELQHAGNMTVEMGTLAAVLALEEATPLLDQFLDRHRDDHLLVDKWFMLSAQRTTPGAALRVEQLADHPLFNWATPNRVYALIGGLTGNQAGFHAADGEGYRVVADAIIRLNGINPQVAARMATGFRSWRQFEPIRRGHAEVQMQRILAQSGLSRDVMEIITRTLA